MALTLVALVLLGWMVLAGWKVRTAYQSASRAKDLLVEFRHDSGGSLDSLRPLSEAPDLSKVERARSDFDQASSALGSPIVAPMKLVPVLGRQLRVVETLSESSESLLGTLTRSYKDVTTTLDRIKALPSQERSKARLDAAGELQRTLESMVGSIVALDTGTSEGLVGSVRKAQSEFISNRADLVTALNRSITALKGTKAFLAGPNTYVIFAANNAEMRAGSGMFLQAGPLSVNEGAFTMGEFEATGDMLLPAAGSTLDPDLQALWGDLEPTREWRNLNLTPRFDESGRMALDMWKALGNTPAQGVISIDVPAVKRLLQVTGPISIAQLDGQPIQIDADNVVEYLLVQQYKELSKDQKTAGREERRSHLGDVAKAIFESFNSGELGLEQLMDALVDVGRGRHLMAYSVDPVQQAAWRELGLAGEIPEDTLMFSLINRGANKLDQFIDVINTISVDNSADVRHVSIDIAMANSTPEGLPQYMVGGYPVTGVGPGDYLGYLALSVPGGAGNPTVEGADLIATAKDGASRVIVVRVVVPRGQRIELKVRFDLLNSWRTIEVLPSARVPPVQWGFRGEQWFDTATKPIRLG